MAEQIKIEVVGAFKIIQIRETREIVEKGKVISYSFHRTSYAPGQDISKAHDKVKEAAKLYWTKEIKQAYQETFNKKHAMTASAIAN